MAPLRSFYPPQLTPWIVRWVQRCSPFLARWLYWVEIQVSDEHLQYLSQTTGDRVLLLPNHPTFHDPIVMFLLSAKLKQAFYYMAAYETFENPSTMFLISAGFTPLHRLAQSEWFKQVLRWMLQRLGMYSVQRGLPDRASLAQTLSLLSESNCHLVIFPEGGCSFQNDTVMPFRVGAVQMAFQTLNKYAKKGEPLPDLYVVPVSIKYRYTGDMQPVIERSLHQLERSLNLSPRSSDMPYQRLRAIAETVLSNVEKDYEFAIADPLPQDIDDRIYALKLKAVESCEQQLALRPSPNDLFRERVYKIQHLLNTQAEVVDQQLQWSRELVEKTMIRLLNFDAIREGYVAEKPTPERFLDTLIRLEREVFNIDQPPPKGYRIANLHLGEPLNLRDFFADYQRDRSDTIEQITLKIHHTVQENLH